jgi:hypothetical protein
MIPDSLHDKYEYNVLTLQTQMGQIEAHCPLFRRCHKPIMPVHRAVTNMIGVSLKKLD